MSDTMIHVEVMRAWPGRHVSVLIGLRAGATVADAIAACALPLDGITGHAVYGEAVTATRVLRDGDRVELLGPLLADPKEARRRRASR